MKIAIIQFPGTNCERETRLAVKRVGMVPVDFRWNQDIALLEHCSGYILAGGFSYEDRIRAGIIASLDPVIDCLKMQATKGKPILGLCNGAQILVESGLVPGFQHYPLALSLTDNKRMQGDTLLGTGYYNDWVHIKPGGKQTRSAFTNAFEGTTPLRVPVAHAEGRFVTTPKLLNYLKEQGVTTFQYCDHQGTLSPHFPINPNGAIDNLAGISNFQGNVLALMPHPERTENGDVIFESMRRYIESQPRPIASPPNHSEAHYHPIQQTPYFNNPGALTWIVDHIITDNAAMTLQTALQQHFKTTHCLIKRLDHWRIYHDDMTDSALSTLKKTLANSYHIFNPNKSFLYQADLSQSQSHKVLTQAKENCIGLATYQTLNTLPGFDSISQIDYGQLWLIDAPDEIIDFIQEKSLLANPFSYHCYTYTSKDALHDTP